MNVISSNSNNELENVEIVVQNGIFILSGELEEITSYDAALDTAQYTSGVFDIENNLRIK